jgi:hypothetical protein
MWDSIITIALLDVGLLSLTFAMLWNRRRIDPLVQSIFWTFFAAYACCMLLAITIGIPVPFAGWVRGWKACLLSPFVVTMCMAFPPIPIMLCAIGYGIQRLFFPRRTPPRSLTP